MNNEPIKAFNVTPQVIENIARNMNISLEEAGQLVNSGRNMTAEEREKRDRNFAIKAQQSVQHRRLKGFYNSSLWGQGIKQTFEFKDWKPEKQTDINAARGIGNKAFKIAKDLQSESYNVLLTGDVGAGKTSLALAIMNDLKKDHAVMFVSIVEWKYMRLGVIDGTRSKNDFDTLTKLMRKADVLVLDDLGKESKPIDKYGNGGATQDTNNMLFGLGDARMGKTTIITTNDSQSQLASKYDEAAISRLITKNPEHTISTNGLKDVREV
ncbi:ATP-binding protein [Weissella minor]|uniref:ATP-binding protein n=1 Tax=Weissella minor TaxID=1620 RepID=UPI003AF1FF26